MTTLESRWTDENSEELRLANTWVSSIRSSCLPAKKTAMGERAMTNAETANHLRRWADENPGLTFSWPTDACGYAQHIRFVHHRNALWRGGSDEEFSQFVRDYADMLEADEEEDHD